MTTRQPIDDNALAAFIDGTLAPNERARLTSILASQPEEYAALLEAAQVAHLAASTGDAVRTELRRPWWRRPITYMAPLLAAASIAVVALVTEARTEDTIAFALAQDAAGIRGDGSVERALGRGWSVPPWSVARGGQGAKTPALAAYLGVRFAQTIFASQAGDSSALVVAERSLAAIVAELPGAGPLSGQLTTSIGTSRARRGSLGTRLRQLSGTPLAFDLGVFLETTRLSVTSDRVEYFVPSADWRRQWTSISTALVRSDPALGNPILGLIRSIESGSSRRSLVIAVLDTAFSRLPR